MLNQPCRVDSAHRALWAVNKCASAKGPRRGQKRGVGQDTSKTEKMTASVPGDIKSTYKRGAGVFDRLVPYAEKLDVRPVIKCSIKHMKSKESM